MMNEEPTAPNTPWKRLKALLNLDRPMILQLYLYAIFSGIVGLSLPLGIQSVVYYIQAGQVTTSWVVLIFLVIGGVVLTGVLQIMQLRITETLQQRIYVRYSFDFAYRFPRIDRQQLNGEVPSELMNRFFDVISLQKGMAKVLLDMSSALLLIVFSLLVLSFYHPFYIAFSILLVVLVVLVFRPIMRRGIATSLSESKHKYKTAYWLQEIARADWSFRLVPREKLSLERVDKHTCDYLSSRESHFRVLWTQYAWMIALKSLSVAALLGLGGYLVINQQMNLGQFVAAEILILLILGAVEKIIQLLETVYDVFTSLEKLGQVKDLPMLFERGTNTFSEDQLFPAQVIKPDHQSLSVVLSVEKGGHTLISGLRQSDATLLLRSLIDTSISDVLQPRWNASCPGPEEIVNAFDHIGWFAAGTHLFDGTVEENILMGRKGLGVSDLRSVLGFVGLSEILGTCPKGFKTPVYEGNFSTDELQRMVLARALVHHPSLLIINFIGSVFTPDEQRQLLDMILVNYPSTTVVCAVREAFVSAQWKHVVLTPSFTPYE